MSKEKQIEELYHILAMEMANELPFIETCELGANAIYKANYRKILENEVVISKEEYRKLKLKRKNAMAMETARKICEHIENDNKKIRKETAEKIFKELYMHFNSDYLCGLRNPNRNSNAERLVIRLAKQFGVEIGDNNGK